jgi:hypothetical protein
MKQGGQISLGIILKRKKYAPTLVLVNVWIIVLQAGFVVRDALNRF